MSELRIALVAEGPTDKVIIEAALKAILPTPFMLTLLQPDATYPKMGEGWGGVFKWCMAFQKRGYTSLEDDITLNLYDLFIVHLDADVADKSYGDCGRTVELAAVNLPVLPCSAPCPPPANTTNLIESLLLAWLGLNAVGAKTVFCIPSKASEAWLASAILPPGHTLLPDIECNLNLEARLSQLPKAQRIRKSTPQYRAHATTITARWQQIRELCSQADVFQHDIYMKT